MYLTSIAEQSTTAVATAAYDRRQREVEEEVVKKQKHDSGMAAR